jgi:nucleoid-associated protein YgaU
LTHIENVGLGRPNVFPTVDGDKIILKGEAVSQEEKEKVIFAAGNIQGVATVDDQITVSGPVAEAARFVTVKPGDTLSTIARSECGTSTAYPEIFRANKPMLAHPDKIYPGLVLRLPW